MGSLKIIRILLIIYFIDSCHIDMNENDKKEYCQLIALDRTLLSVLIKPDVQQEDRMLLKIKILIQ